MESTILAFLRISSNAYNKTMCEDHTMYMNSQEFFRGSSETPMLDGQKDPFEGAVTTSPFKMEVLDPKTNTILASLDSRPQPITNIHLTNNTPTYIYCVYCLDFDSGIYTPQEASISWEIPWEYVDGLWKDEDTEILVITSTQTLINQFADALSKTGEHYRYGFVNYDLERQLKNKEYFHSVLENGLESAFHKMSKYSAQREFRFALVDKNNPSHREIQLSHEADWQFHTAPLQKGKIIKIQLDGIELNSNGKPVKFKRGIKIYDRNADSH